MNRNHLIPIALSITFLIGAACTFPGSTKPMVKIGLIAPFEGPQRALGYEVLYAVRLAVWERNEAGGVAGATIELVALNDNGIPHEAAQQVDELWIDSGVLGVIGPWTTETATAAAPQFAHRGLPAILPVPLPPKSNTPFTFQLAATPSELATALAQYLTQQETLTVTLTGQGPWAETLQTTLPQHGITFQQDSDTILYSGSTFDAGTSLSHHSIGTTWIGGPEIGRPWWPALWPDQSEHTCYIDSNPDPTPWEDFITAYQNLAGFPPSPRALTAYVATRTLLDTIAQIDPTAPTARQLLTVQLQSQPASMPNGIWPPRKGGWHPPEAIIHCWENHTETPRTTIPLPTP